jgi:hypothetical protein
MMEKLAHIGGEGGLFDILGSFLDWGSLRWAVPMRKHGGVLRTRAYLRSQYGVISYNKKVTNHSAETAGGNGCVPPPPPRPRNAELTH